MPDTTTTNYGFTKPQDGASNDTWGPKINTNLDLADAAIKGVSDVAAAALPKAGGTMTGRADLKTATLAKSALGSGSGAVDLNLDTAQMFTRTATGNTTFTFSNCPAGAFGFMLRLTGGGSYVMTWPATVLWANGLAPDLSTGTDILVFLTDDGGTTFRATVAIRDAH